MIGCAKKAELRLPSGAADHGVDSNAVATELTFWNRSYGEALPAEDLKLSSTSSTHVLFRTQALCIHQTR